MCPEIESTEPAHAESRSASVALAVFNGAEFLPQQLESLVLNLRPGDEIIAVDDASTDKSVAILEACQSVPEARVVSWGDISRVDIRSAKGMMKVESFPQPWTHPP